MDHPYVPLVYLASPYSATDLQVLGYLDAVATDPVTRETVAKLIRAKRYAEVCLAAGELVSAGVAVFSPIAHSHGICLQSRIATDWRAWAELDRVLIERSDVLIVLQIDGWRESAGVRAEVQIAREIEMPVIYWDRGTASAAEIAQLVKGGGQDVGAVTEGGRTDADRGPGGSHGGRDPRRQGSAGVFWPSRN